ncbi:unnamed protein product [Musa textilis]
MEEEAAALLVIASWPSMGSDNPLLELRAILPSRPWSPTAETALTTSREPVRCDNSRSRSVMHRRGVWSSSAPLGMWDRFPTARTVQQMMETMERIMDDPRGYSVTSSPSLGGEEYGGSYRRGRTPWEIKEGEGVYKMRFDMPGMTKEDVKVWVEERMLVIKAEKLPKEIKEGEEEEWSAKSYGRYNSRIALPDNIDLDKIKAEVKDGVLYVTIPKASPSSKVFDINVR